MYHVQCIVHDASARSPFGFFSVSVSRSIYALRKRMDSDVIYLNYCCHSDYKKQFLVCKIFDLSSSTMY